MNTNHTGKQIIEKLKKGNESLVAGAIYNIETGRDELLG